MLLLLSVDAAGATVDIHTSSCTALVQLSSDLWTLTKQFAHFLACQSRTPHFAHAIVPPGYEFSVREFKKGEDVRLSSATINDPLFDAPLPLVYSFHIGMRGNEIV